MEANMQFNRIKLIIPFLALLLLPTIASTAYADGGFPIIGVLHAGQRPEGIAVDTQTHMVYIAYESPSLIVGFDPVSSKVRWHTKVGDAATDVQVDSTNHHVYAIGSLFSSKKSQLAVLDGTTGRTLFTATASNSDN